MKVKPKAKSAIYLHEGDMIFIPLLLYTAFVIMVYISSVQKMDRLLCEDELDHIKEWTDNGKISQIKR